MTETLQDSHKWTKRLVLGFGCFAVLVGFLAVWLGMVSRSPALKYSRPKMPNPNAYDYYVQAGDALVDPRKIDAAATPASRTSLAEKEALLKANSRALTLFQRGFACEYLNPAVRTNHDLDSTMHKYSKLRAVARLKLLEGGVLAAKGQWHDAVNRYLDVVELGKDTPRGGPLIALLVGIAIESIGRRPIFNSVDHLTAGEAKAAAQRLEQISAEEVSLTDALLEESAVGYALVEEQAGKAPKIVMRIMQHGQDVCLRDWLADPQESYSMQRRRGNTPRRNLLRKLLPWMFITEEVYVKGACSAARNGTADAMLVLTLALHAYSLEHGAYPDKLDELVPSYLKRVPGDPFDPRRPLHYNRVGTKYVLYSVGPDGIDDGGKPIFDPKQRGRSRYRAEPESKGDVVADAKIY